MILEGPFLKESCDIKGCHNEPAWHIKLDRDVPFADSTGMHPATYPYRCLKHFREVLTPEEMAELEMLITLEAMP